MFKSKFSKPLLIILVILMIVGIGFFIWRKNIDTKKVKKEKFVCSFNDEFKCEVEKLFFRSALSFGILPDGSTIHWSFSVPIKPDPDWKSEYEYEQQLVGKGEKAVPVLIEIIKKTNKIEVKESEKRYKAIYMLGRIGGREAVDFLISMLKSKEEDLVTKFYVRKSLSNINNE